ANPSNSSTPGISHVPEADYLALETNHVAQENNHLLSMRPKNDLSKEIASVTKIYTEDQKYSGTDNSSLDFKLNIFYDICSRAGLPLHGYKAALPTMLKGVAEDHYYSSGLSSKTFQEACHHLRQFFEGPEFYRQNLTKWNAISLQKVMNDNSERSISIYQGFQLLLSNLLKQRHGLHPELRSNMNLINKLITACQGVPACRMAVADPPEDLAVLINKLQSSISTWEKENPQRHGISHTDTREEVFYTDRRYYNQNRNYNQGKRDPAGKCYVCQKSTCRSWRHTEEEQRQSKEKYRQRFNNDKGMNGDFSRRYRQYMIYCEGNTNEEEAEAFEALVTDTRTFDPGTETDLNEEEYDLIDTFVTSFGSITTEQAMITTSELANRSFTHCINDQKFSNPIVDTDPFSYNATTTSASDTRYNSEIFMGIMIDTGASSKSTAGYGQFQALQNTENITLDTSTAGQVNVQFGIGITSSIGSAKVSTPIGNIQFHIVNADTPFLLCLADMDNLGIYYNNLKNVIVTPKPATPFNSATKSLVEIPVIRRFGHPFLLWNSALSSYLTSSFDMNPCFLTDVELRRLHRRFGHPSVDRLQTLLRSAGHEPNTAALEHLTKFCHYCQKFGKSPGRFRFNLKDEAHFNFNIIVDIMYIDNMPLLHVVDEATRFQSGR
ncbi:GAG-pre-integrase domain-containing protein, partial [Aspergillus affinis]|uniref:GAG-pre-integrase domain-containing protein n=1 Tax=Aspergillus affinis TaxID=1070780 RepID=UPI0022FE7F2E